MTDRWVEEKESLPLSGFLLRGDRDVTLCHQLGIATWSYMDGVVNKQMAHQ